MFEFILFVISIYIGIVILYGSEVCNVEVQRNKKKKRFYLKLVLININFACGFSILQYKIAL